MYAFFHGFFAYSFLFGMGRRRIIAAGNCLRIVSCPAWGGGVSLRQETISEWFPIRHGAVVYHSDRKLFVRRFLDSASLRSK